MGLKIAEKYRLSGLKDRQEVNCRESWNVM
jgi:hypothetical protein